MTENFMKFEVLSTQDFDLSEVEALFSGESSLGFDVSDSQMYFRAAGDVPSWLQFAASFPTWITIAGSIAAGTLVASITNDIYSWAKSIVKAKLKGKPSTKILLSVPYPSEHNPCLFEIRGEDLDDIAGQIIAFAKVASIVQEKLVDLEIVDKPLASPITMKMVESEITLEWAEFPKLEKSKVSVKR